MRCSKLPLVAKCPAAQVEPQIRVETSDAAARNGTATHTCLQQEVHGRPWSARAIALQHGADPDEVGMLAAVGAKCWWAVAQHFPNPATEMEVGYADELGTLGGHTDVLSCHDGAAWILDWKSGFLDEDHADQVKGYAWCALHFYDVDQAHVCVIRIRGQTADWEHYTRDELQAWWIDLAGRLQRDRETFRPGRHCRYCPRFMECPAAGALLRRAADDLLEFNEAPDTCTLHEGARLATMLEFCRILEDRCALVRDLTRARVALAGGVLPTGDGRELALVQQERRGITVTCDSMGLVAAECASHQAYLATLRFSKSAIEDAIRDNAPRGKKKAAVEELMRRLEEAGVVETKVIEKLEIRRSVPQLENHDHAASPTTAAG